ncbi:two-component regulator propeller domain-containing protein [Adhaeribacter terreus]|uniref:Two-component regulator propeller domain-containing protein n=1 Tax=Adhaeribacter terreus TaxID=529703 RepID=A0ABW0E792_9BACT
MRAFLLTLLLVWSSVNFLSAQQYNLKTWTPEDGLPQTDVTSMVQGHWGFMWIGTAGGLSTFDGLRFTNFTKEHGLSSTRISCIYQTHKGATWIGTYADGLNRLSGFSKFTAYGKASGLPEGGISSITEDKDGRLYVATAKGIYFLEGNRFKPLPASTGVPAKKFWRIHVDRNNNLWLATLGEGVYRYNGKKTEHFLAENGLRNNIIYSIFESRNGTLWFGAYGGFSKFDGKKFTPYRTDGDKNLDRTMAITEDADGKLWMGMDGGGLVSFDGKKMTRLTTKNGLVCNYIHSLLHDREGNLWLGALNNGLQRYTPSCFTYYLEPEGVKNKNIRALAHNAQGNLWIGTFDGGVGVRTGDTFKWYTTANGLPNNIVNHITKAPGGAMWFATNHGVARFDGTAFTKYSFKDGLIFNIANFILPETDNRIWIATNEGLSLLENNRFRNYKIYGSPKDNHINCLFKDKDNQLWAGTKSGVYLFKDGTFRRHPQVAAMNFREITSITQDYKGNLWVGSFDHGLARVSPNLKQNAHDHIEKDRNLLSESVTSLRIDSANQLWVGTIGGLNRLDMEAYYKNPAGQMKRFTNADGFRGIEVSSNALAEGRGGNMWIGTVNGLIRYTPENERPGLPTPLLNIFALKLFGQPVNWKERGYTSMHGLSIPANPKLPYDENHITFEYRGIYLTNPDLVTYMTRLEGFDRKWSEPSTNTVATYSNLPPGNYKFMVKACIKNGGCVEKTTEYAFTITPPFWSKDRIVAIAVLLIAGFAFGLVRWRERNLRRLNTLLEENVKQRTLMLEKKNLEKEILLKEVHHRVKNNLQIITSLLNLQSRHLTDPAALETLRDIKDRIKSISMLHMRLYQREELASIDLSEYVQTLCRSLFASYGIREDHVRLEFDIPTLYLDIDTALTLGLIVNELVSNTLKYAFPDQRKGTLLIELLRVTETDYTLTISDDGTGLPDNFEEKMATSFGLQLVSSLIKKLHGTLKFYSEGGTQIRLQFVILPQ